MDGHVCHAMTDGQLFSVTELSKINICTRFLDYTTNYMIMLTSFAEMQILPDSRGDVGGLSRLQDKACSLSR
jgi:hypothetical protein